MIYICNVSLIQYIINNYWLGVTATYFTVVGARRCIYVCDGYFTVVGAGRCIYICDCYFTVVGAGGRGATDRDV